MNLPINGHMKHLILFFILALLACEKETQTITKNSIPIVWRKQLGPINADQIPQDPGLYANKLIFGYQTGTEEGYYIYDKQNGDLIKDLKGTPSFKPFSTLSNKLYYSNFEIKEYRVINLDNYEINFYPTPHRDFTSNGITTHGDELYASSLAEDDINNHTYSWKRANKNDPFSWEDIYAGKFTKEAEIYFSLTSRVIFKTNEFGDEIMFFSSVKAFRSAAKKGKYKVTAFNLTKKQLVWETNEFELDIHLNSSLGRNSIILKNQIIIPLGGSQLMSFDINTGKEIWKNSILGLGSTNYYEKNGKISFLSDVGILHSVDAINGKIISKKIGFVGDTKNWAFHKGIMYFTTFSGKLFGVDAETHEIKLELISPNKGNCSYCSFFFASPVVDPLTNRLYISDRKEVICYQLP
jgi:outer membrane protein assembly factor BamB